MDNAAFLEELFHDVDRTQLALWVNSFVGDPKTLGTWSGEEFDEKKTRLDPGHNNYYVISALNRKSRIVKRNDAHFGELHVVFADDVGTKVNPASITLPPTYKLETSPKNFHYGYRLSDPITDVAQARRLVGGLVDKGVTDPGAGGITRYARLPIGANWGAEAMRRNGGQPFETRLHEFSERVMYGADEIAKRFGFSLEHRQRGRPAGSASALPSLAADHDPIAQQLNKLGLLTGVVSADGWLGMHCPWEHEHPHTNDSATAYLPGGTWKCLHGHCAHRTIIDLLAWLETKHGQDVNKLLEKLPRGYAGLVRGVRAYAYAADVGAFVSKETGALYPRDVLNDYHANLLDAPYAKALLKRNDLQRVRLTTFRPGATLIVPEHVGKVKIDAINLWHAGPIGAAEHADVMWLLPWLDHLHWLFPTPADAALVLDFLTYLVQRRGHKINWGLILVAIEQGTGRDTLMAPIIALLGDRNVQTITGAALESSFNGYLVSELVYLSELETSGDLSRKLYAKLKDMIVVPPNAVRINEKHIREWQAPKTANFVILSNNRRALTIDYNDRRFAVVETVHSLDEIKARSTAGIYRDLHRLYAEPGWLENLHAYLKQRQISATFEAMGRAPDTPATDALRRRSEQPGKTLLREWIRDNTPPCDTDIVSLPDVLHALAQDLLEPGLDQTDKLNRTTLGYWLDDLGAANLGLCQQGDDRERLWAIRETELHMMRQPSDRMRTYRQMLRKVGREWRKAE